MEHMDERVTGGLRVEAEAWQPAFIPGIHHLAISGSCRIRSKFELAILCND